MELSLKRIARVGACGDCMGTAPTVKQSIIQQGGLHHFPDHTMVMVTLFVEFEKHKNTFAHLRHNMTRQEKVYNFKLSHKLFCQMGFDGMQRKNAI